MFFIEIGVKLHLLQFVVIYIYIYMYVSVFFPAANDKKKEKNESKIYFIRITAAERYKLWVTNAGVCQWLFLPAQI